MSIQRTMQREGERKEKGTEGEIYGKRNRDLEEQGRKKEKEMERRRAIILLNPRSLFFLLSLTRNSLNISAFFIFYT